MTLIRRNILIGIYIPQKAVWEEESSLLYLGNPDLGPELK